MAELRFGWPIWIGVVADDIEAQRRFYRDVLGLKESGSGDGYIEFEIEPGRKLELLAKTDEPQYAERRYQAGFEVPDIKAAAAELRARGVEQISEVEGGPESGQYWCYFRDPEGNVFELAQRVGGGAGG